MSDCLTLTELPPTVQKADEACFAPTGTLRPELGFQGTFAPTPISLGYRIGLVAVCAGMALLLAVYLGIIALAGYAVYYHLTTHHHMVAGPTGSWVVIVAYLWPAMAGGVLIFFMVKPIMAGRPEQPPRYSLTRESDPALFTLIERICEMAQAPLPSRVDVDCQVNASASFRRGILSMRGNDVVLTIGLPLAAGLTVQEFAGVLAHEFGHFAQGAGMKLTYLIRALSTWFARVVYERDEWDVRLVKAAYSMNIRLAIFLHCIRLITWLTRRVLWGLMYLGHAISCFMLRQMEYDADSYEVRLAGSEAFARTASKVLELNAASEVVGERLQESWKSRRLPDNLPRFINACIQTTPAATLDRLRAASRKTRFLDTHPCDADRVSVARSVNRAGVLHNDRPASALFKDFDGLCRAATRFHYENNLELLITDQNLVSHEASERESQSEAESKQGLKDFFFGLQLRFRPLVLPDVQQLEVLPEDLRANVQRARKVMEQSHPAVQKALAEYEQAELAYQRGFEAISQSSQQAAARASETMQTLVPLLAEFEQQAQVRLVGCLRLLSEPKTAASVNNAAALQAEAAELLKAFEGLSAAFGPLQGLRRNLGAFIAALDAASREERRTNRLEQANARINELLPQLKELLEQVRNPLRNIAFPFQHARQGLTIAEFSKNDIPSSNRFQALCNDCNCCLERLLPLYERVLGRLAYIALVTEHTIPGAVKKDELAGALRPDTSGSPLLVAAASSTPADGPQL